MPDALRKDLVAIILNEAFSYNEAYIDHWLSGKEPDRNNPEPNHDDRDCLERAHHIVSRFEARCSRIDG